MKHNGYGGRPAGDDACSKQLAERCGERLRFVAPDALAIRTEREYSQALDYRNYDCPHYDLCLTLAAALRWKGFSCRKCRYNELIDPATADEHPEVLTAREEKRKAQCKK